MKIILLFFIGYMVAIGGCSRMNSEIQDFGVKSSYVDTVAKAEDESDDTWVTLNGKITGKITHELYLFQDSTGEIKVRINQEALKSGELKVGTKVKLTGKINKELSGIEVVASRLEVSGH